ncbi:MAG: hypothetical protein FJ090_17700, partial [Deltaproteobacteria bacterium]|nr:hypothetical protein [Deltaproteobacteria bacterium]
LGGPRRPWPGVLGRALEEHPLPDAQPPSSLSVAELVRWTRQPLRMLGRYRLGLPYDGGGDEVLDEEPLSVEDLERWQFGELLSRRWLQGKRDINTTEATLRARAQLPPASPGRAALEAQLGTVAWVGELLPPGGAIERHAVRLRAGETELVGSVETVGGEVVDFAVDSPDGARRLLRTWVAMLALAAASERPVRGRVIGMGTRKPAMRALVTPSEPGRCLQGLLSDWQRARRGACLRLEKTSRAVAAAYLAGGNDPVDEAQKAAWRAWSGGQRGGESADRGLRTLFGDAAPFVDEAGSLRPAFIDEAVALWKPILAAMEGP